MASQIFWIGALYELPSHWGRHCPEGSYVSGLLYPSLLLAWKIKIYCLQKVVLIMGGPFIYYQLLSSENGASMCAALKYVKTSSQKNIISSETGPHCMWPFYVWSITILRKWASMCAALTYVWMIPLYHPPHILPPYNSLQTKNLVSSESRPQSMRTFNA